MRTLNPGQSSALATLLCTSVFLASLPAPMQAAKTRQLPATVLTKPAQIDLLLSRFTFGPTEVDRQAVERMGIDAWFDRQLQPASIDDSALERRLDVYPALRMTQADRLARYPEPATLRQIAKTGVLPQDPELHAILSDQAEIYEARRQSKAAPAQPSSAAEVPIVRQPGGVGAPQAVAAGKFGQNLTPAAKPFDQGIEPMPRPRVDAILAMQPTDRYGQLLSLPVEDLIAFRKTARGPLAERVTAGMTPLEKETLVALNGTNRMIGAETQGARLLRDIYSQRELEAVMTDFWLNHFNVYSGKSGQEPSLLPEYAQVVQAHALGHFEDLLVATAQSPAMLLYLDNAQSTGPDSKAAQRQRTPKAGNNAGLNENYARELMELHTLGVNGGYTQRDVTEVARVFTGWTLERPNDGGAYTFNANRHQPGSKVVLGKTISEDGEGEGRAVLHMLATSPATARFICTELAQRFVSDTPPPAMVGRMMATFLKSSGDMRSVLRAMVHSPEFFTAATVHAKLKTPLEYVTSAVRASGAEVSNPQPLVQALQQFGMPLYGCQPPTGYKWDEATWLSSSALINRMNFALSLSTNRIGGAAVDWTPVLTGAAPGLRPAALETATDSDAVRKEQLLEGRLLMAPASAQTRSAVLSQGTDETAKQAAQQFATSSTSRPLTDAEKDAQQQDRLDAMMAGKVKGAKNVAQPQRGIGVVPVRYGPPPADAQAAAMAGLLLGSPEFQRR